MNSNKNIYKFVGSSFISMVGSEALKLGSAIYVMKITGDYWLTSILYLLIQLPSIFTYSFAGYVSKKIILKKILVISDLLSIAVLIIILILNLTIKESYFSYSLLILNAVFGTIHSFRFPAFRGSINQITTDFDQIKKVNILLSKTTVISLILGPILTAFISFSNLPFYYFIILDAATYLLSILFVLSIKYIKQNIEDKHKKTNNLVTTKSKTNTHIFIVIFSFAILLAIITFSRQTYVFQTIGAFSLNYSKWSTIIILVGGVGSIIGSFTVKYISNKIPFSIFLLLFPVFYLFLILTLKNINPEYYIYFVLVFNFIFSVLYSYSLTNYYNFLYLKIPSHKIPNNIGISMIVRILTATLFNIGLTFIFIQWGWIFSTSIMAFAFLIINIVCIYYEYKILKINKGIKKNAS